VLILVQRSDTKEYRYGSWWSVWWTGSYSMVLSKASFFHRQYLDHYTNRMLPSIREYVTENRCNSYLHHFYTHTHTKSFRLCYGVVNDWLIHYSLLLTLARNCEDIAMSFLVANVTGAPPIWVQGQ
jgi:hypothetical protein